MLEDSLGGNITEISGSAMIDECLSTKLFQKKGRARRRMSVGDLPIKWICNQRRTRVK